MYMEEKKYVDRLFEIVSENLKKRKFDVYIAEDGNDALDKALNMFSNTDIICSGGSRTVEDIGLLEYLRTGDYNYLDRYAAKDREEKIEIQRKCMLSDWYVSSVNAMTMDGIIVNAGLNGNRVAAHIYGPKNVLLIVGYNKIVPYLEDAIDRMRNVATVKNSIRFNLDLPCTHDLYCSYCDNPDCLIAVTTIIEKSVPEGRIKIILVKEELGF